MRALAFAVLLMLAAAGCSGKGTGTTSPSSTAPATHATATNQSAPPLPPPAAPAGPRVTIGGCTNFGGVFPVSADAAQALLPDGFKVVPAASDPQGGATLYVLALKCDDATVNGTSVGAALLGYAELAVTPDAAHAVKGISDYTVPLLFAAAPKALGDALSTLHLGNAGAASWSGTAAGTITAQATIGTDGFTLAGEAPPASPAALESGSFVVFGVKDKQVVSVVNGTSAHGSFVEAAATLQAQGNPPLLGQARPATRGFSVSGFTLTYAPEAA